MNIFFLKIIFLEKMKCVYTKTVCTQKKVCAHEKIVRKIFAPRHGTAAAKLAVSKLWLLKLSKEDYEREEVNFMIMVRLSECILPIS